MKKLIGIFIMLVIYASCEDPPVESCIIPVWMNVQQSVIPDSCRLEEPVQIEVEVILNASNYKYIDPDIEDTESGCTMRIMGERNTCELGIPSIGYEWHSFDILPSQTGSYIIEINNFNTDNLVDTIIVY